MWRLINGPRVRRLKNAFEVMKWQNTQVVSVQSHLRRLLTRCAGRDDDAAIDRQRQRQRVSETQGSERRGYCCSELGHGHRR